MLYQVGPLALDTFPIEVGSAEIETSGDFAKHELISSRRGYEFVGPGEDSLDLSGQLLPFHIGGLSELEFAKQLCTTGEPVFVMRGDGQVMGWYQLMKVKERHSQIGPGGVGFVVAYALHLEKIDDPGPEIGGDLIDVILSLFG